MEKPEQNFWPTQYFSVEPWGARLKPLWTEFWINWGGKCVLSLQWERWWSEQLIGNIKDEDHVCVWRMAGGRLHSSHSSTWVGVYHCSAQHGHAELLPHEERRTEKLQCATRCIVWLWMIIALDFLYFSGMLSSFSRVQNCATLWSARLLRPWDSPGKNTGVGCHSLLQGIFPIQGSNLHWQAGSLPLVPPGKPLFRSIWIWSYWHVTDFTWHMI